ncbi:MAG: hypothetical protein AAF512_05470, partial [Pseudomonadota bacterium]
PLRAPMLRLFVLNPQEMIQVTPPSSLNIRDSHPKNVMYRAHPIKKELMRYMLSDKHRLSVSNGWIKWQTPES